MGERVDKDKKDKDSADDESTVGLRDLSPFLNLVQDWVLRELLVKRGHGGLEVVLGLENHGMGLDALSSRHFD